ncbi:MAG: hypothetical protein IPJ82_09560 [Lewinellaceae bacterium]|nr:hypothetical protein [Lewinellaceae bacterium]
MHTLFFGGMSQFWLNENDSLIRDNRLPFVKTVSRVSRLSDGSYEEVPFDTELPYFTGTSAEFILAGGIPTLPNGIVDYDVLPDGEQLLGYIAGGIVTPDNQTNPFIANNVGITSASAQLIRVFLAKNTSSASPEKPLDGRFDLNLNISPNPATDVWRLRMNIPRAGKIRCILQDAQGKIIRQADWGAQSAGAGQFDLPATHLPAGAYWLTLNFDGIFMETTTILKQ